MSVLLVCACDVQSTRVVTVDQLISPSCTQSIQHRQLVSTNMNWSWGDEGEDEEPSVDYMEYLARRASCSVLPDPPKAMVNFGSVQFLLSLNLRLRNELEIT